MHLDREREMSRKAITVAFVVAMWTSWATWADWAHAAPLPTMSHSERARLLRWKVVTRVDKGSRYWRPTAFMLFSVSPRRVMSVVKDISSYDEYMPKVAKSTVVRRKGRTRAWAVIVTNLPWPMRDAWVAVKYTWSSLGQGAYRLDWMRERGSMRKYWGRLDLYPWGRYWTLAVCTMQAEPDAKVPLSLLNKKIVWGTEQLLQHLRARVDVMQRMHILRSWSPD